MKMKMKMKVKMKRSFEKDGTEDCDEFYCTDEASSFSSKKEKIIHQQSIPTDLMISVRLRHYVRVIQFLRNLKFQAYMAGGELDIRIAKHDAEMV